MQGINCIQSKVEAIYEARNPSRDSWADQLFEHHVFLVSTKARELAERFGANAELAEAAGMLHDIADAIMSRFDPSHEEKSLYIAHTILAECGFTQENIAIIDDALRFHSCRNGKTPVTMEGKILATADAVIHLTTPFYQRALAVKSQDTPLQEIRDWALPKIERDYHVKILFDEIRDEVSDDYENIKSLFV